MELIYRGIKYIGNEPKLPAAIKAADNHNIISRQSNKVTVNANFPLLGYLKQLFSRSESKPVFDEVQAGKGPCAEETSAPCEPRSTVSRRSILDPITFWYIHKRKFLENFWLLDEREKLERCWELTLKPKPAINQKSDRPIKLKYRGVTYYR
ncbi:DUF4278 domain-containing protein [Pleurocapsales cyanobacterium LEGE 06147]|nr:DUF4278 domain-containing protein [Pleurocapsales cyanobacterium LEGE 06147]